ncbi:MAG: feruloyl-CoA synthase, partial [Pseudomonadota bacterium]|nr:feruloyl-CoA synthase [Pseudomonadota bacterium]
DAASGESATGGAPRYRAVALGGSLAARIAPQADGSVLVDRCEVGLLVFPRLDACRTRAGAPAHAAAAEVLAHAEVAAFFQRLVDGQHAAGTGTASRVARAIVLAVPPSIDRGEVTDKGSINQGAVLRHRAADVERLYGDSDDVIRAR